MKKLNIVLVEPEIPQNTGNIARTCAATGAQLHIVKPMGFSIDDKKMKRAGLDYWDKLHVCFYESLDEFMTKHSDKPLYFFTTKGQKRYTDVEYKDEAWLVFGKETKGLPEELLFNHKSQCVRLPMLPHLRSLNLSNTVCVAAYEVLRHWDFEGLEDMGTLTAYDWESAPEKS